MNVFRREILKKLSIFTILSIVPVNLEARIRRKRKEIKFWDNNKEKKDAQLKLLSLFQRPYNDLLLMNYINYITTNEKNFYKDKKNISYMLFFNIHVFSVETREIISKLIKLFYFENEKNTRKKEIEEKILNKKNSIDDKFVKKKEHNNKNNSEHKDNKKSINNNSKKTETIKKIQEEKDEKHNNNSDKKTQIVKKAKKDNNNNNDKVQELLNTIKKINLTSAIIFYSGDSYLSLNNLFLYRQMNKIPEILKKIKQRNHHWNYQEVYLKNIWNLFVYNSLNFEKNNNGVIDLKFIKKHIKFIESFLFRVPFLEQKEKFRDRKFYRIWRSLFRKKTYKQYTAHHYQFAYLLALLSFYYSLLGYQNYSVLFLNKIKEKFLIKKDVKTIMFYFYIIFLGYFLLKQYTQAIKYFEFISNFDNYPSIKELGFLVYSRASIDAYKKKEYQIAWEYADKAVKYGVNLDPVKYLNDVILMKKVLKDASVKYINFLTKGNNYDLINYVKSETLKTLSLTF